MRRYGVLHFALMASVVLILTANDAPLFLISWECMSILCYLLVNYERGQQTDARAGYIMLAMSEAGFLAVVLAFSIAGRGASRLVIPGLRTGRRPPFRRSCLGYLPARISWFRRQGRVGARELLAASLLYRDAADFRSRAGGHHTESRLLRNPATECGLGCKPRTRTGLFALVTGSITALVGILYATTENDMKTMLAHSSIENAGIIVAGIGASLVFRASGHGVAAAIALTAALYHMVNHSVYKTLLFQGAGDIEAATGTREMDRLGGLAHFLPALSVVFSSWLPFHIGHPAISTALSANG